MPWKGRDIVTQREIVVGAVNVDAVEVVVTVAATVMGVSEGGRIRKKQGDHTVEVRHLLQEALEAPAKNEHLIKIRNKPLPFFFFKHGSLLLKYTDFSFPYAKFYGYMLYT